MAELCREFGISRKTGHKIFDRYKECGVQGLTDRSRRPYHYANQLPFQVENYNLNMKREHPSWGARKIRERLLRRFSGIPMPAKRTVRAGPERGGRAKGFEPSTSWCRTMEVTNLSCSIGLSSPVQPSR
jgi:putative transposase